MEIFGNKINERIYNKALRTQKKFIRKFGDDRNKEYHLELKENPVLTPPFDCKIITTNPDCKNDDKESDNFSNNLPKKPLIIGNIRMGLRSLQNLYGNGERCKITGVYPTLV